MKFHYQNGSRIRNSVNQNSTKYGVPSDRYPWDLAEFCNLILAELNIKLPYKIQLDIPSLFQELPHEYVPPNMLKKVALHGDTNKLYATEIRRYRTRSPDIYN